LAQILIALKGEVPVL